MNVLCFATCLAVPLFSAPILNLRLTAAAPQFANSREVSIQVEVENLTKAPFEFVRINQVMFTGFRGPTSILEAEQSDGTWKQVRSEPAVCGSSNLISPHEFIKVMPGKTVEIMPFNGPYRPDTTFFMEKPGHYRLRLKVDTSKGIQDWLGGPSSSTEMNRAISLIRPHWANVPKGVFYSNVIEVTVRS